LRYGNEERSDYEHKAKSDAVRDFSKELMVLALSMPTPTIKNA
jgi:hypothetical protein